MSTRTVLAGIFSTVAKSPGMSAGEMELSKSCHAFDVPRHRPIEVNSCSLAWTSALLRRERFAAVEVAAKVDGREVEGAVPGAGRVAEVDELGVIAVGLSPGIDAGLCRPTTNAADQAMAAAMMNAATPFVFI